MRIRWTDEDQLGFKDFRFALQRAILGSDTPITIGIFGEWGSGKTSLMKMLEKHVKKVNGERGALWFDAWRFSDQEVVSRALIVQLIKALRPAAEQSADEKRLKELDDLELALYHDVKKDVT